MIWSCRGIWIIRKDQAKRHVDDRHLDAHLHAQAGADSRQTWRINSAKAARPCWFGPGRGERPAGNQTANRSVDRMGPGSGRYRVPAVVTSRLSRITRAGMPLATSARSVLALQAASVDRLTKATPPAALGQRINPTEVRNGWSVEKVAGEELVLLGPQIESRTDISKRRQADRAANDWNAIFKVSQHLRVAADRSILIAAIAPRCVRSLR